MIDTVELRECPFCGGAAETERTTERFEYSINGGPDGVMDYGYVVYCTKCEAGMFERNVSPSSAEGAIKEWNKRTAPAQDNALQPDWSQAPAWAMWFCVDADGRSWWSENPEPTTFMHLWEKRGTSMYAGLTEIPLGIDWRTTLTQRPAQEASDAPTHPA